MLTGNKSINNLSEEFKKSLAEKALKRGEHRIYRLVRINKKGGAFVPPTSVAISPTQVISDPTTNFPVRIGCVESLLPNDQYKLLDIKFTRNLGGQIICSGDRPRDVEIDLYLMHSNQNASNPNRDKNATAYFYLVDPEKEAEADIKSINSLAAALTHATTMTADDLIKYAYARNLNAALPTKVLRSKALLHAKSSPEEFVRFVGNSKNTVLANAKRAQELGIIGYDAANSTFFWQATSTQLKTVPRIGDAWALFSDYLISDEGKQVYIEIKNQLEDAVLEDFDDGLDID